MLRLYRVRDSLLQHPLSLVPAASPASRESWSVGVAVWGLRQRGLGVPSEHHEGKDGGGHPGSRGPRGLRGHTGKVI